MLVSAQRLDQWPVSSRLRFTTNHRQTISDVLQRAIPREHAEQIVMKACVRTMQFLRVQVTVKLRRACNPSDCIRLNPACLLNACCTSSGHKCMLVFVFPLSHKVSWRIPYCSYALVRSAIFMLNQHCCIDTHNEYMIKWCGVYKIVYATSWCEWQFMTHSLALLALTTTAIDSITP
jgi:hypothetical protein